MKASKWLKWKIGAVCTLGIAVVFQAVRANPQFDLNRAAAASPAESDTIQSDQQRDQVIDDWFDDSNDSNTGGVTDRFQRHRGGRFQGQDGASNNAPNPGFDTQTGRS